MSKLRIAVIVAIAVSMATPTLAGGNANFFLGYREINNDTIDGLELDALNGQLAGGVSVDFHTGTLPFNWVAGLYRSSREEEENIPFGGTFDMEATFTEVSFGLLKNWKYGRIRPFVGGGLTYVKGELEISLGGQSEDFDDSKVAFFEEGGVYWHLENGLNIGLGGRFVFGADLELEGSDLDADYFQGGLILGWGWGD